MSENEKPKVSVSMLTEQEPTADWEGDVLGRADVANHLTDIVENAAEHKSYTVSLHGGWGTGKTYLLRGWQKQLQKKKRRVVYFNAWKDDFQADALTAVVGQLWEAIKSADWKEIILAAKTAIPTIAKKKALRFLGLTKKDFQSADEMTVDEYLAVRKKLDGFRERLKTLAATVKDNTKFPLVFIVDELDRCRPTFAIEVLERVKHLFDAPNIVFVFGVNKTELEKSIKSVYGNIDSEDYLRRFFDISLNLPPASASAYCRLLLKHSDLDTAMKKMEVINHPDPKAEYPWLAATDRIFSDLVGYMHFSLREVEHAIRLLRFAVKARISSSREGARDEAWSISLLILLKVKESAMYADFVAGKLQCADIIDHFHGLLAPHSDEQNVHRQGEIGEDAFSTVEGAMYRFGKERDIKHALHDAISGVPTSTILDFDENCLAKRTKNNKDSASSVRELMRIMGNSYWLSLKETAALLDLADDFRR